MPDKHGRQTRQQAEEQRISAKYKAFCKQHGLEPFSIKAAAVKLGRDPSKIHAILEDWVDAFPDKLIEMHGKLDQTK